MWIGLSLTPAVKHKKYNFLFYSTLYGMPASFLCSLDFFISVKILLSRVRRLRRPSEKVQISGAFFLPERVVTELLLLLFPILRQSYSLCFLRFLGRAPFSRILVSSGIGCRFPIFPVGHPLLRECPRSCQSSLSSQPGRPALLTLPPCGSGEFTSPSPPPGYSPESPALSTPS